MYFEYPKIFGSVEKTHELVKVFDSKNFAALGWAYFRSPEPDRLWVGGDLGDKLYVGGIGEGEVHMRRTRRATYRA